VTLLPIFGFAAVMLALGARLVRSGLRTHGVELWLGLFFSAGALAMPVRFALANGADVAFDAGLLNLGCQALLHAGVCCLAGFVWRTFRPNQSAGRAIFASIVILLSVNLVLFGVSGAHALQGTPVHVLQSASLALVFGWAFAEAAGYYGRMRRRAALGLSDPVVTNRFLLWTLWTGGLTLLPVVVTAVRLVELLGAGGVGSSVGGALGTNSGWSLVAIRTAAISLVPVIALSLWLSFFPPRGYRDWIRSRHPA
jgi:hypothetical protein